MRSSLTKKLSGLLTASFVLLGLVPAGATAAVTQQQVQSQLNNNRITKDINLIVNFLSALVGVVIVANIIIGGIQYSMAGGNPQATTDAKHRIANALLTLFIFLLLWALLNWLIPGGLF